MIVFIRLVFLYSFFNAFSSYSQSGYVVSYTSDANDIPLLVNGVKTKRPLGYLRFVFNDSVSYSYGMGTSKRDPYRKNKAYGSKVLSKSIIAKKGSNEFYVGINGSLSKPFYQREFIKQINWFFMEDTATILGYLCKKAYSSNDVVSSILGEFVITSESHTVWFTSDFNDVLQTDFNGVKMPGLVLKFVNTNFLGSVTIIATSVKSENAVIAIPSSVPIWTREEALKKIRK